jgi:N utilization substance protein A
VYVSEVHDSHRGPQIIVSRAHRFMLRRLFEQEVPEIYNGTVEIMAIAREAGARSKVAVAARQSGIDPVGSCVGMRGVRIQNIVNELGGEKIDVVEWNEDPARFVGNALSPARVLEVRTNEAEKTATVIVPENQLSLAIGREGQNARLAAKLTGWRIDIKSDVVAAAEAQAAAEAAGAEPIEGETSAAASGDGVAGASESEAPAGVSAVSDGRSDPVAAEASAGADS